MPILGSEQKAAWKSERAAREQKKQDALRADIASITSIDDVLTRLVEGVRDAYYSKGRLMEAEVRCSFEVLGMNLDAVNEMRMFESKRLGDEKARALEEMLRQRYEDKTPFDLSIYLLENKPVPHVLVVLSEVPRP